MNETIMNFLKLGGLVIILTILSFVGYYLVILLKRLSDKYLGEKISLRIHDAIDKLTMTTSLITQNMVDGFKDEYQKSIADGKITDEEFDKIVNRCKDEIMETVSDEMPTLSKYFLGKSVSDFVFNLAKKHIVSYIKRKFGVGGLPLTKSPD
jgi:hypothetical protein